MHSYAYWAKLTILQQPGPGLLMGPLQSLVRVLTAWAMSEAGASAIVGATASYAVVEVVALAVLVCCLWRAGQRLCLLLPRRLPAGQWMHPSHRALSWTQVPLALMFSGSESLERVLNASWLPEKDRDMSHLANTLVNSLVALVPDPIFQLFDGFVANALNEHRFAAEAEKPALMARVHLVSLTALKTSLYFHQTAFLYLAFLLRHDGVQEVLGPGLPLREFREALLIGVLVRYASTLRSYAETVFFCALSSEEQGVRLRTHALGAGLNLALLAGLRGGGFYAFFALQAAHRIGWAYLLARKLHVERGFVAPRGILRAVLSPLPQLLWLGCAGLLVAQSPAGPLRGYFAFGAAVGVAHTLCFAALCRGQAQAALAVVRPRRQ